MQGHETMRVTFYHSKLIYALPSTRPGKYSISEPPSLLMYLFPLEILRSLRARMTFEPQSTFSGHHFQRRAGQTKMRCYPRLLNPLPQRALLRASLNYPHRDLKTSAPATVFSGIQPTGIPHLGNYLGALRQWVGFQNSAPPSTKLIFCIVDLHAITQPQNASNLRQWKKEMLMALLAIGLNPDRCIIFEQSRVPAHSELMWILSCVASTGRLSRMTQWKVGSDFSHSIVVERGSL